MILVGLCPCFQAGVCLLLLIGYLMVSAHPHSVGTAVALLLQQMPHFKSCSESWQSYLRGPGWSAELAVSGRVAPGFQIKATDAVAAALWAVVSHWDCPVDACVAAVHYGGDTDTIACLAGECISHIEWVAFAVVASDACKQQWQPVAVSEWHC